MEEAELMRVFVGVFAGNKSEVSYRGTTTATTTTSYLPDQNMNICFGTTPAAAASVVVEDVISIGLTVDIVPKTKESILDVNTVNCCPCAACQRDGG